MTNTEWNRNGNGNGNEFRHKSNEHFEISCYLLKFNSFFFHLFTNSDIFFIARIAALRASITSDIIVLDSSFTLSCIIFSFAEHSLFSFANPFLRYALFVCMWKPNSYLRNTRRIHGGIFNVSDEYSKRNGNNKELHSIFICYLLIVWKQWRGKKNAKFCNADRFGLCEFFLCAVFLPRNKRMLLMIAATQSTRRCHRSLRNVRIATFYLTFICRHFGLLFFFAYFYFIFSVAIVNTLAKLSSSEQHTDVKKNHGKNRINAKSLNALQ